MSTQTKQARSAKGAERRDAILEAARRMLLDEGYAAVSLRKSAKAPGMSIGNLQYTFATKDDLIEAILIAETRKPLDILSGFDWKPHNAFSSIHAAVTALMRYSASKAGRFYAIMESLALHDSRYARLKADGYAHVFAYIETLIGIVSPDLPPTRRAGLAQILVALIDGASLQVRFARGAVHGDGLLSLSDDMSAAIAHLLHNRE